MKFEELVIVTSITNQECYEQRLEKSLSKCGISYTLIKTDPKLSWTKALNSIIKYENLKDSRYIAFCHQDVEWLDEFWGWRIIQWADSLPDFGYGGTECITKDAKHYSCGFSGPKRNKWGEAVLKPTVVQTCDSGTAIIPTKLFLEQQFDEQFDWFPVQEDYACWVQFIKKLKVYCLPISIWHSGCQNENRVSRLERYPRDEEKIKIFLKKWGKYTDFIRATSGGWFTRI